MLAQTNAGDGMSCWNQLAKAAWPELSSDSLLRSKHVSCGTQHAAHINELHVHTDFSIAAHCPTAWLVLVSVQCRSTSAECSSAMLYLMSGCWPLG